jgi:hypothetical protein
MSPAERAARLRLIETRLAELRESLAEPEIDCSLEHGDDDYFWEGGRSRADFVSDEEAVWKGI